MLFCLLAVAAAVSCTKEVIETPSRPEGPSAGPASMYTTEIEVKFTEEMAAEVEDDFAAGKLYTKSMPFNELVDELGITSVRRVFSDDERFIERQHRAGLHLWYRITVDSTRVPMTKAADYFAALPGIQEASPVRKIRLMDFNDPYSSLQWGLYQPSGVDINVRQVWEDYTTGSNNVIVAVVDEGVATGHEDLPTVIEAGPGGSMNFTNFSYTIGPGDHGYHVAGVIAAASNNGRGVSGIAGGDAEQGISGVKILSCQIFEGESSAMNAPDAIRWGADNGAVISQNSWGAYYDWDKNGVVSGAELDAARNDRISGAEQAAVDYFIDYAGCDNQGNQLPDSPMKGGVVIFAAGNENIPYGSPASYERIIAVGAIQRSGSRASYSNYGDWVDICAPGSDIYSTVVSGYASMSGTSMACPQVSGVAALLVSHFGGPGFTNEMLTDRLLGGANSEIINNSSRNIGPLLDAYGSFTYGGVDAPERVEDYETVGLGGRIEFTWAVTPDSDEGKAYGYVLLGSEERTDLVDIDLKNIPSDVYQTVVTVGDRNVGDELSGALSGLEFETDYYVCIYGYDYQQNYSGPSDIRQVRTTGNNAPEIAAAGSSPVELKSHETFTRSYIVRDPDAHRIELEFTPGSAAASFPQGTGENEYVFTVVGNLAPAGEYTATVKVTDAFGASTSEDISYRILENHAPVSAGTAEPVMLTAMGEVAEIDMSELILDPDGEQLKWSIANSAPTSVHANMSGSTLYLTALSYGNAAISVTGTDCRDEQCTVTVQVLVKNPDSPLEVYPNPVSDYLSVRTMEEMDTRVMITTSTGATVYDETAPVSVFNPAVIDMRNCAPGQYRVYVSFGGNEYTRTVVKL